MSLHLASTQQQRAAAHFPLTWRGMPAQLDPPRAALAERMNGAGRHLRLGARSQIHEAKSAIIAEMEALDRPVTSKELYARLDRAWSLKAIEYHLLTLVKATVVEVVFGLELHFRLTGETRESTGSGCR